MILKILKELVHKIFSIHNISVMQKESTNNELLSPYGVPYALLQGQNERVEELNHRMIERVFPDISLEPNFDPRPVPTKYSLFPICDRYASTTVPIQPHLDYYPEIMFNPGNSKGPVNGYLRRVDLENDLRSQTRLLKSGDPIQGNYIPSLESDLYIVNLTNKKPIIGFQEQTHPLLFTPFLLQTTGSNIENKGVGANNFNNHTRTQLRCSM